MKNKSIPYYDSNRHQARLIVEEITNAYACRLTYSEAKQAILDVLSVMGLDDHYGLEIDGMDFRLIKSDENVIWPIYVEYIQTLVEDCYSEVLNLDKIPPFIAVSVDWEVTAQNAYADGYGHSFSSYDGSEYEAAGYYIFRTN